MKKVFVFGWYGSNNLGDEIFKVCFQQLWPALDFTFGSSKLPRNINQNYDALWVGGGSFLDQPILDIDTVTIPIFFIGVGISSSLSDGNKKALERAKLIICRDSKSYNSLSSRHNARVATDLVFSRNDLSPLLLEQKQITVILNDFLTPVGGAVQDWRSISYYWFLQEFSKIMDRYAHQGYKIKLIPMCINSRFDDRRIAAAVQGRSSLPQYYDWVLSPIGESELRTEISKSTFVVTQRFHGLVYSIIEQRHCLPICTHDKFNSLIADLNLSGLDYYGITDVRFREVLNKLMSHPFDYRTYLDSAKQVWDSLVREVNSLI